MRFLTILTIAALQAAWADDGARILRLDHYVTVKSAVPAMNGANAQIYVREITRASTVLRGGPTDDRVALFIHGAGTPAEVAFDTPLPGYNWAERLAAAGFDVFAMDMTGYGASERPVAMNDPCNLSHEQQKLFVSAMSVFRDLQRRIRMTEPCKPTYDRNLTTLESDWSDIEAVADYIVQLRGVERLNLLAWSLGGPRSMGWAAKNADRVRRIVVLAPAYNRAARAEAPAKVPAEGAAFNTQTREEFFANWDRQIGCADQLDTAAREGIWKALAASDPVGATWGPGVRRAPNTTTWGWTQAVVAKTEIPTLLFAGAHDKQVPPERVHQLYQDLGSKQKVLVDLACSSHMAMWEKDRELMFRASEEWLTKGTVNGQEQGAIQMGK
jgi:pimeloyl-ACP methyl ester carboxylesterase